MENKKYNFIQLEDSFQMTLNLRIYSLDVIYSVSYIFLDKAYIWLDSKNEEEVIVNIYPKNNILDKKLVLDFGNELLTHLDYKKTFQENKSIRDMILQRAIITNDSSLVSSKEEINDDYLNEDLDSFEDLEEVIIPWEEENEKDN